MPYKNHDEKKKFHREYMREYNKTHALTEEQKQKKSIANKLWREKNKDKLAQYQKERWLRDKEKIVLRKKKRQEENPLVIKEQKQKSYQKNKEKVLVSVKKYAEAHPDSLREYKRKYALRPVSRYNHYKRNAGVKGRVFELTKEEFLKLLLSPCHYCGGDGYGVDRKDSSVGYSKENSLPCCSQCNYMKRDFNYDVFLSKIKQINSNLNY